MIFSIGRGSCKLGAARCSGKELKMRFSCFKKHGEKWRSRQKCLCVILGPKFEQRTTGGHGKIPRRRMGWLRWTDGRAGYGGGEIGGVYPNGRSYLSACGGSAIREGTQRQDRRGYESVRAITGLGATFPFRANSSGGGPHKTGRPRPLPRPSRTATKSAALTTQLRCQL